MKLSEATYFPDANELTRHGFVSHMEDFIGKLLGNNPLGADVDDYLKGFDIDAKSALDMLTRPEIEGCPESAVVIRTEKIKNGGTDEFGKPMKDEFQVIYKVPKRDSERGIKGLDEKLRNLYIKLFENHIVKGTILNEDGEGGMCGDGCAMEDMGGATNASSSGQFVQPLFGMIRRKGYSPKTTNEGKKKMKAPIGRTTMYITEKQLRQLEKMLREEAEMDTAFGDFGYDAPVSRGRKKGDSFYGPTFKRDHIMSRNNPDNQAVGHVDEGKSEIHIKKKNKGKFTATKKRTGKSTSELLHSPNKKTRARANFARMAKRGWKPLKKDE